MPEFGPLTMAGHPTSDELASIIVLCCNELSYTRLCLDSVLRRTSSPYELVLVDNGSTDGTPAYLEELRSRPEPIHVEIIRNETNRGFPAGCNQALTRARGRYLVFLNNATIVAEGWLDGLIAWCLHDWPKVGMVGAVSNYTAPPQQVPVDYVDGSGLDAFAARRRSDYAYHALRVQRLTGFCLLVRREVFDAVGTFDERFGLGFFDDDDLCVRARETGFHLLVALNVFVHHFGSRTFASLSVDCLQQLHSNFEQFRAKWGPDRTAGYRLPEQPKRCDTEGPKSQETSEKIALSGAGSVPLRRPGWSPRVSLCLIVKNEEANLPACLGSARDLVDEIIVIDTGSMDRTKEMAAGFGARVFDFPWVDSFAAARNESLRHATGQWIFWLDADDRIDEDNRCKLRELFASLKDENAAYSMKCLCLPDSAHGAATVVDHIRLFRNHAQVRWEYRVHEQILGAIRRSGGEVRFTDVVIHHSGYQDPALRGRKLERDLRLLQLEDADRPDDPFTLFNLGSVYNELGRSAEALPLLRRSLERSHPSDSIVRKLYALIVQCHRQLGQPKEALEACRAGRRHYPDDTELLFTEGMMLRELGNPAGAEAFLLQLVNSRPGDHFASVDAGLRGYKTRHNLAVLYREQGRFEEAQAQWQTALDERPDFLPGWLGLAELHLVQSRWGELEQTTQRIESLAPGTVEANVLRARGFLARKDFSTARRLLEDSIVRAPRALWPRVILSHVLLQEARDWTAAEQTLRDVLELEPTNAEARQNLALLLRTRHGTPTPG